MPYRSVDWTAVSLAIITCAQSVAVAMIAAHRGISHIKRRNHRKPRITKDAME